MKWIFREQPVPDTGIDGHIETRDENSKPTGRLIGCQVKSGATYFREETADGFTYRGNAEHLAYWRGHSLPVIVILCDEQSDRCYWQVINAKTVTGTGKGWKAEVPKSQILGDDSKEKLEQIADTGWLERTRTFTTSDKFFRRLEPNPLFDYDQTMQGRKSSLEELHDFLTNPDLTVVVLAGRGGIGKSKLIRQWVPEAPRSEEPCSRWKRMQTGNKGTAQACVRNSRRNPIYRQRNGPEVGRRRRNQPFGVFGN
jgi:hypothetical protein